MSSSERSPGEARRRHAEAIVARHLHRLFQRLPMLAGLRLRPDLEVDELSVFTWPGCSAGPDLYDEVVQWLAELAEERPEAVRFVRGRTFARTVH
jgi:ABC-type histidine transport system ATPase subunit